MKKINDLCLISVYGVGKLKIKADTIRLIISISNTCKTVKEAQKNVNKIMNKILKLLSDNKINEDFIQTTDLSFHPQYEWQNRRKVLLGQKVVHEIICTIKNIANNLNTVHDVLDSITTIYDSIECSLSFYIEDYEAKMVEARESAYTDAYNKAKKYSELAGLKILKNIKISEFEPSNVDTSSCIVGGIQGVACDSSDNATEVSVGTITIESKLYCDFIAN